MYESTLADDLPGMMQSRIPARFNPPPPPLRHPLTESDDENAPTLSRFGQQVIRRAQEAREREDSFDDDEADIGGTGENQSTGEISMDEEDSYQDRVNARGVPRSETGGRGRGKDLGRGNRGRSSVPESPVRHGECSSRGGRGRGGLGEATVGDRFEDRSGRSREGGSVSGAGGLSGRGCPNSRGGPNSHGSLGDRGRESREDHGRWSIGGRGARGRSTTVRPASGEEDLNSTARGRGRAGSGAGAVGHNTAPRNESTPDQHDSGDEGDETIYIFPGIYLVN